MQPFFIVLVIFTSGQAMIKRCPILPQSAAAAGNVNMPVGGACSFKLPINSGFRAPQTNGYIIPTHSPKWDENREADCSEDLYKSAQNCLKEAQKRNLSAVAIPAIGSGGNKIPKQLAVVTLVNAIKHFLTEPPGGSTTITHVYFVLFDKQVVELFRTELVALVE
jgi:O-acetyl-ADP-ribose deacetylase (regulator of RNase III)